MKEVPNSFHIHIHRDVQSTPTPMAGIWIPNPVTRNDLQSPSSHGANPCVPSDAASLLGHAVHSFQLDRPSTHHEGQVAASLTSDISVTQAKGICLRLPLPDGRSHCLSENLTWLQETLPGQACSTQPTCAIRSVLSVESSIPWALHYCTYRPASLSGCPGPPPILLPHAACLPGRMAATVLAVPDSLPHRFWELRGSCSQPHGSGGRVAGQSLNNRSHSFASGSGPQHNQRERECQPTERRTSNRERRYDRGLGGYVG